MRFFFSLLTVFCASKNRNDSSSIARKLKDEKQFSEILRDRAIKMKDDAATKIYINKVEWVKKDIESLENGNRKKKN